jgi:hypothetical protein
MVLAKLWQRHRAGIGATVSGSVQRISEDYRLARLGFYFLSVSVLPMDPTRAIANISRRWLGPQLTAETFKQKTDRGMILYAVPAPAVSIGAGAFLHG